MNALSITVADSIATMTLDQPGSKVNVLSRALWSELQDAVAGLSQRTDTVGLIIESAKPGIFIAGADLKELADVPAPGHQPTREYIEQGLRVLDAVENLPFPTIACIDGAALGGGLEVALACDFRIAGSNPKAMFGLPEITLGMVPGWGGTQRLPRLVGPMMALEMLLQNLQLDSKAGMERGLLTATASSEKLREEAICIVRESHTSGNWRAGRDRKRGSVPIEKPIIDAFRDQINREMQQSLSRPAALAAIELVANGSPLPLADALKLETETFLRLAGSPESRQLIAQFFAARKK
jgi:enoyl-CoA hydratase/carnithine racemase